MNKVFKFLGYVANSNGIKFGLSTDPKTTLRFDHRYSTAPGSTKANPVLIQHNEIAVNMPVGVITCDSDCKFAATRVARVSWSVPVVASPAEKAEVINTLIAALESKRISLEGGFLPTTEDIALVVAEV